MNEVLRDVAWIVVALGGGLTADGAAEPSTLARARAAAALVRGREDAALILSGSRGGGWDPDRPARSEAALMADVAKAAGVAPERVFEEDDSRDTIGNAALVRRRYLEGLAPRPITLVTSPFHLMRATLIFARVLGPAWPLDAVASAAVPGDDARAASEPGFLRDNLEFFAGIVPGDLAAVLDGLARRWPYYQRWAATQA
jgi:uncharacterized SAM-binding protein YcdF (DUF218 family)